MLFGPKYSRLFKMSTCPQELWHCIHTNNQAKILVDFYNKLGLSLKTLKIKDRLIYISQVAPLCITENCDFKDKNSLIWTEKICSEFESAFSRIRQNVCQNLAQVKVQNTRNFNR